MHSGKAYANPTNVKRHMKKEHPSWCRSHTTYLSNFINNANCWILVCILLCSSHYRLNTYFISPTNVTSPSLPHSSASDLARPHQLSLGLRFAYLRKQYYVSTSNGWHDTGHCTPTVTVPVHASKSAQHQGPFAEYKRFQCFTNTWNSTHAQHVDPQQRAEWVTIVVPSSVFSVQPRSTHVLLAGISGNLGVLMGISHKLRTSMGS